MAACCTSLLHSLFHRLRKRRGQQARRYLEAARNIAPLLAHGRDLRRVARDQHGSRQQLCVVARGARFRIAAGIQESNKIAPFERRHHPVCADFIGVAERADQIDMVIRLARRVLDRDRVVVPVERGRPRKMIRRQVEIHPLLRRALFDRADLSDGHAAARMMGQLMLQYKLEGMFMYALGAGKSHISLHLLPMYGSPDIYNKYIKLLDKAKFQKGCINFTKAEQMPLDVVKDLIKECAKSEDSIVEKYKLKQKK